MYVNRPLHLGILIFGYLILETAQPVSWLKKDLAHS